jgi:CO/xanthine dehydrogenase Mo-binding subunit
MSRMAMIGANIRRVEDNRRLRGTARYIADIQRPGMLNVAIFRSQHAHARLIAVDVTKARAMPGVVAVITFDDMKGVKPIPMRLEPSEGLYRALQRPLASDRLRYVGEPIAVVVAENRYLAEDALEGIDIEVDELEAHVDARSAIKSSAEPIHPGIVHNIAHRFVVETGNIELGMADADAVFEDAFYVQRHSAVPLETRGLVAEYDDARQLLTVWGPTKVVHFNHGVLASLLNMPPSRIRMIEVEVGGGFGVRGEFYPEDYLIPFLALKLHRPIRWIEDRNEHLKAANHSREQWHHLRVGYRKDGRIVAFDDQLFTAMGGYIRTHGATLPTMTAAYMPGPYKFDNYRCDAHCVLVNKTPAGTYRGPGRFGASFVRERAIDVIARRLGLDPAEVRLRNFIPTELMPYATGTSAFDTPTVYDSGNYAKQLKQAMEKFEYLKLKSWCHEQRQAGRAVGIGIGCFVEKTGGGPWEYARVEVDSSGEIVIYSGAADLGQGVETVLSQIVADTLPLDIERIRIVHGDTAVVPFGVGAFGSRSTVVAGSAALRAAEEVKKQLLALAATALQTNANDLIFENGRVVARDKIGRGISYAELASLTTPTSARDLGVKAGISAEAVFHADRMAFPYGVHLALVEVDQKTGFIKILKYLIAFDVGRSVNPTLVKGQIVGGFAQGLGGALLEEFVYDDTGQLLSGSFMDYLLPSCAEVPDIEVLVTEDSPSPFNPLGVKGAGEGGIVAVGAALANAVCDAFDGLVNISHLPLTPELVLRLARDAEQARAKRDATRAFPPVP